MSVPHKFQRGRYCRGEGFNWHADHNIETGRMFRCCCMPQFRLPGGKTGPNTLSVMPSGARRLVRVSLQWKRERSARSAG